MKNLVLTLVMAILSYVSFGQDVNSDYARKLAEINDSILRNSGNLSLYYARADIYDILNDFTRANSDYRKVLDLYQRKPYPHYAGEYAKSCYRLADDYFFRQSNREKALDYVAKGLLVVPDFKDLQIMEAILIGLDTAQYDIAMGKYEILSLKYPDDLRLNIYYAKFLEKSAPMKAIALYEKVLAANPMSTEVLLSVATLYNNEATRLSEAVITDPVQIYKLAEKAAFYFEKLHQHNPSDKEVSNVLIRLYDELDERAKAEELQKANAPY